MTAHTEAHPGRFRCLRQAAERHRARLLVGIYAITMIALGPLIEGMLIGPIVFLAAWLGFWPGLVVFTTTWLAQGLAVLALMARFWPHRVTAASSDELSHGPIRRLIARMFHSSRLVGTVAVAWFFGPVMSPPFFRAFGYHGRPLLMWVIASAFIFCPFWFAVYGGGYVMLTSLV
jgi:hypothetical protein